MFVQLMEGKAADREKLQQQLDAWRTDVRPGAIGYVGSTCGFTDDGRLFLAARFDSEQAARANSGRPQQDAWWAATEACFDGDVKFVESSDTETFLAGGSDAAGFVQAMKIPDADRDVVARLDAAFAPHAATFRPDLIGGLRVWTGPTSCVEINYFTSEADARANESAQPPPELMALFEQYGALMANADYLDLRQPLLDTA